MEIAPDFFDYFAAAGGLLYEDPTLLCVSAWNDNGQRVSRITHSCVAHDLRRPDSCTELASCIKKHTSSLSLTPRLAGVVVHRARSSTLSSFIARTSSQVSGG